MSLGSNQDRVRNIQIENSPIFYFLQVLTKSPIFLHASISMFTNNMLINFIIIDINECARNPCSQSCVNTEGTFECNCLNGYQLEDNGRNCSGRFVQNYYYLI